VSGIIRDFVTRNVQLKWPPGLLKYYSVISLMKCGMLQRTVFINEIRMLQRTRRNTIGRRSTRVRMTCSIIVLSRERLFLLFVCVRLFVLFIRESLFLIFTKERLFMLFKFTCTVYKSELN